MATGAAQAARLERCCGLVGAAISDGRCLRVRLMSGEHRSFGGNGDGSEIRIPFPPLSDGWTLRTWSAGIALQCAPSKQRIAGFTLRALTTRQRRALALTEAGVALGWISRCWPGLIDEIRRFLPELEALDADMDGETILRRAVLLAQSGEVLRYHPILGRLPAGLAAKDGILSALRRAQARMPWSTNKRYISPGYESLPAGGESHIKSSHLPTPSRPEEDDIEISPDQRAGIPYPEWNMWSERFIPNHVAVLERRAASSGQAPRPVSPQLRRWFEEHTHRVMRNRLEDGCDLDIDRYIDYHIDQLTGVQSDARVFRDLQPAYRDVTTALLLDGSASLSAGGGDIFKLELDCADDLCRAMALAGERHGLFIFSGKTRHRVDITCLKDFHDSYAINPGDLGIRTGGYTRLGAPLRHLTRRLLDQASERRLLIIIGDGLISDEGYEGRYAWADSAHAVEEAEDAGISMYYIGVGQAQVDPLPMVFGPRRSTRIQRIEELPNILGRVHRQLIAA